MDIESKLPRSLRISDQEESISSSVDFLAETMGIEVYPSPPRALRGLVRRVENTQWLLDVGRRLHARDAEGVLHADNPPPTWVLRVDPAWSILKTRQTPEPLRSGGQGAAIIRV